MRLISLCTALVGKKRHGEGEQEGEGEGEQEGGSDGVSQEYRWRGKYERPGEDGGSKGDAEEDPGKVLASRALVLIFEALAGWCRAGWEGEGTKGEVGGGFVCLLEEKACRRLGVSDTLLFAYLFYLLVWRERSGDAELKLDRRAHDEICVKFARGSCDSTR